MSILSRIQQNNNKQADSNLTQIELEFLLVLIKEVNFKGEHVELLYNIVSKVQQQWLDLDKNK
jgi:hypothetical protein